MAVILRSLSFRSFQMALHLPTPQFSFFVLGAVSKGSTQYESTELYVRFASEVLVLETYFIYSGNIYISFLTPGCRVGRGSTCFA